jgi:hypothetical protein
MSLIGTTRDFFPTTSVLPYQIYSIRPPYTCLSNFRLTIRTKGLSLENVHKQCSFGNLGGLDTTVFTFSVKGFNA